MTVFVTTMVECRVVNLMLELFVVVEVDSSQLVEGAGLDVEVGLNEMVDLDDTKVDLRVVSEA